MLKELLITAIFSLTALADLYNCDFRPQYMGDCPNYNGCHRPRFEGEERESCSCLDYCAEDTNCCSELSVEEATQIKNSE
jgi:hypothetical protein